MSKSKFNPGDRFRYLRGIGDFNAGDVIELVTKFANTWVTGSSGCISNVDETGPDSISDETLFERVEDETLLATFEIGGATISLHKGERLSEPAPAEKSPEVPAWIRWMAYDHDGSLWGYAEKPQAEDLVSRWVFTGQPPIKLAPATAPRRYRDDWKNTLIEVHQGYHVAAKTDAAAPADQAMEDDSDRTRQALENALRTAAYDLLTHMGAAAVTLPMQGGGEIRAGQAPDDLHLMLARGGEVRMLREKVGHLEKELDRERMCHAACGSVALSNTRETLERVMSTMHADYKSASVSEVAKAVGREIEYREREERISDLERQLSILQGQHSTQANTIREQDKELAGLRMRVENQREQLRQRTAERDAANQKLEAIGDVGCMREQADAWHQVFKLLGEVDPWMGKRATRGIDEALASIRYLAHAPKADRSYREQFDKFAETLQRAGTAAGLLPGDDLTLALVPKIEKLQARLADVTLRLDAANRSLESQCSTLNKLHRERDEAKACAIKNANDASTARSQLQKARESETQAHDARRAAEQAAERRNRRIGGEGNEPCEQAGMPSSACVGGGGSAGASSGTATRPDTGGAGGESGRCILHIIELMPTKL